MCSLKQSLASEEGQVSADSGLGNSQALCKVPGAQGSVMVNEVQELIAPLCS